MNRDMSSDLDGVMSTRNAGELVSHAPAKTTVERSPGLVPVSGFGEMANARSTGPTSHDLRGGDFLSGLGAMDLKDPKTLLLLGAAAFGVYWFAFRK